MWRLGHSHAPYDFPPRHLCSWRNRFDDPQRQYRTLYGARQSITCLRELLADLRPNPKAIADFEGLFGDPSTPSLTNAGVVSSAWRKAHVLVQGKIITHKVDLARIEHPYTMAFLSHEHASLLAGFGIRKLQIKDLRTRERIITQQFSRSLYTAGLGGILFKSRLDGDTCFALFEGRASMRPLGEVIPMTTDWPELIRICGEYNLILRPMDVI